MIKSLIRSLKRYIRNKKRNHIFNKYIPEQCKECEMLSLCRDFKNKGKMFDDCYMDEARQELFVSQLLAELEKEK